tara:strand:+ start:425 stop:748 length:324 start_codon:yes stop_codon:yes gene_type:complete
MRNLGGMMKKVQEMQGRMEEITREIETSQFRSSVGGGAVVATLSGKGEIITLEISPELLADGNSNTLAELVMLAVNNAKSEADAKKADALKEMTSGLPLPPGLSLPF